MTSLASCDRPVPLARGFMAVNERPRDSDRSRGRPEASTRREDRAERRLAESNRQRSALVSQRLSGVRWMGGFLL